MEVNFQSARFESAFGSAGQLPESDMPEIIFCGRSNVGKSSLMNKILGRKSLARVSSSPGKTATVNFYRVGGIRLVDLPGYGYAKISAGEKRRFASLMEGYFSKPRNIPLAVQLVDMRHPPSADDIHMLNLYLQLDMHFIIALTKADKLKPTARRQRLESLGDELDFLPEDTVKIPFSAVTGEGAEEIKREILKSCGA